MPAPVITPDTSIHSFRVGEFFVYQPAASESPTGWAAAGLPAGVTINATTGKISGFGTEPGFYNVSLTATNGSGTSPAVVFPIGIERSNLALDGSAELDVDLSTGDVSNPAISNPEVNADGLPVLLWLKKGDSRLMAVGFKKRTWLQQLPVASVNLGLKEYDDENVLLFSDGLFAQVGSYDTARFQIVVVVDRDKLKAVLGNYEGDKTTWFDAPAEIRWGLLHTLPGDLEPSVLEHTSKTFAVRITRDISPDIADEE